MITVIVVGEGQTEETFVRDILAHSLAVEQIGLARLQQECRHFSAWIERLRALGPLA